MFIAVGFTYAAWLVSSGKSLQAAGWANVNFVVLDIALFANSRDTLANYYSRVAQWLDIVHFGVLPYKLRARRA